MVLRAAQRWYARMTNLRSLLIDARQFVGKSRCSQGHSMSEVLDRAKPGDRHCLYCKEQAALHERLMLAVSELTSPEPTADPTRCTRPGCRNMGTYVDGRCGYHTAENRQVEPIAEPAHWAEMRAACTCPKSGTSSVNIMCPISLPHPWHKVKPPANPSALKCPTCKRPLEEVQVSELREYFEPPAELVVIDPIGDTTPLSQWREVGPLFAHAKTCRMATSFGKEQCDCGAVNR